MSERAYNEAITNMYNDIHEMNNHYNDLKNEIIKISTDISWMREDINGIKKALSQCSACKNPEEIIDNIEKNKNDIRIIRDEQNTIRNQAIGISAGIGIIVLVLSFLFGFFKPS